MAVSAIGNKYFSVSEVKAYLQCPVQHQFKYVERISKPNPPAVTRGIAYDRGLQAVYRHQLETGELPPVELAEQAALAALDELIPNTDWAEDSTEAARADVQQAIALYMQELAPKVQPSLVQDRFLVEFENTDWAFLGYIDLVTTDGVVVDNKLLGRSPVQDDVDQDLQLTAYALGYQVKYGGLPAGLRLDCIIKTKTPKVVQVATSRTEAEINRFLKLLGHVAHAIDQGIIYPRPGGWWCGPKACQFWIECHERF